MNKYDIKFYASLYYYVLHLSLATSRKALELFILLTHLLYFSQRNWFWTLSICKILYLNSGTVL